MKEDQQAEWKRSWRDEYLKWLCGFANAEGGVLVIGRDDKGTTVGGKDAEKLSGMIEAWGRGIERIMAACREAGTPEPEVEFDPTGLWLTFHYLPEHRTPVEVPVKTRVEIPETRVEIPETRVEIPETRVEASVKTPDMILELLQTHPQMSLAQVAVAISKSLSAVERAVANLTEEKALRHIGPRKGGHWEVLK
jgi:ATP-dependent DNA helicase RecG